MRATTPLADDDRQRLRELGTAVIRTAAEAIAGLVARMDERFADACATILDCHGRVVVLGMGKSGHIGGKIAATLASTGTPAFFVHPGEAGHGDLGMVIPGDVVIALSNSGETDEILNLLPMLKRQQIPLIALTGRPDSTLAEAASVHLDIGVAAEACPLGLAPTASTATTLAMGDALAIALLEQRGFTAEDFARSHPSGRLGRRLLVHVGDIMLTGDRLPQVHPNASFRDALVEMTDKGLGMTAIVDANGHVAGVFTDGDLRRTLDQRLDLHATAIGDVMTAGGVTVGAELLAAEAVALMEEHRINALLVVDTDERLVGALNMHTLLRAGVV